jgi:hypothetical protein
MYDDSIVKPITYIDNKGIDAAGGVWSCANDIEKWVQFILDSASVNGKKLLTTATFKELFKPQSIVTDEEFYPTQQVTKPHWKTYGLGWFQEDYRGKMVQFHTGSLDGAVAIIGLIPDQHFGVYIFGNMDHTELRHALMYKAMDLWCFNDNSNDWSSDLYKLYVGLKKKSKQKEKEEESKRVMNTKPSLPLSNYTGIYENEIYGHAQIVSGGGDSLLLKYPNNNNISLRPWNYDTFSGRYMHEWNGKTYVQFLLDGEGKVAQFEMEGLVYKKK